MAVAKLRLPEKYCAWPPHPSHPHIRLQRCISYDRTSWRVSRSNVLLDISDQFSRTARDCNRVRQIGMAGHSVNLNEIKTHRGAADVARPRRRGDRIAVQLADAHPLHLLTTGYGTFATWRRRRSTSAF